MPGTASGKRSAPSSRSSIRPSVAVPGIFVGGGAASSVADRGAPRSESKISMLASGKHTYVFAFRSAPLLRHWRRSHRSTSLDPLPRSFGSAPCPLALIEVLCQQEKVCVLSTWKRVAFD